MNPYLTGRTSLATIHVRLPIPMLNAAVKSIRMGRGSHRTPTEVVVIEAMEEKFVRETRDGGEGLVVVSEDGGDNWTLKSM